MLLCRYRVSCRRQGLRTYSTGVSHLRSRNMEPVSPGKTKVGFIGLGVMGTSMCSHIIKAGYNTVVYNRTKEKAKTVIDLGAKWADTPRQVAEQSDVVFAIVGYPKDVREVILGESGVLRGLRKGGVVVDMTTSNPSLAREIAEEATKVGCYAVDAPVSGGDIGAREARLSIMIGGDADVVQSIHPLFSVMGKNIRHMGPPGAGQHTKMMNQILISTTMIGLVEGLLYAQKAGLDVEEAIAAVSQGAAGSWSLNNYSPRILKGNYEPGFFVEHFIKDMEIAMEEAQRMELKLPGLELALQMYKELKEMGYGKKGTHALMKVLEKINNTQFKHTQ